MFKVKTKVKTFWLPSKFRHTVIKVTEKISSLCKYFKKMTAMLTATLYLYWLKDYQNEKKFQKKQMALALGSEQSFMERSSVWTCMSKKYGLWFCESVLHGAGHSYFTMLKNVKGDICVQSSGTVSGVLEVYFNLSLFNCHLEGPEFNELMQWNEW